MKLEELLELRRQREEIDTRIREMVYQMCERFNRGETIDGDSVATFALAHYGLDDGMLRQLRALHSKLEEADDILITNRLTRKAENTMNVRELGDSYLDIYRYGVFDDKPVWDVKRGLVLPMQRHAYVARQTYWEELVIPELDWEVAQGPIVLTPGELLTKNPYSLLSIGNSPIQWDHLPERLREHAGMFINATNCSMEIVARSELDDWFTGAYRLYKRDFRAEAVRDLGASLHIVEGKLRMNID